MDRPLTCADKRIMSRISYSVLQFAARISNSAARISINTVLQTVLYCISLSMECVSMSFSLNFIRLVLSSDRNALISAAAMEAAKMTFAWAAAHFFYEKRYLWGSLSAFVASLLMLWSIWASMQWFSGKNAQLEAQNTFYSSASLINNGAYLDWQKRLAPIDAEMNSVIVALHSREAEKKSTSSSRDKLQRLRQERERIFLERPTERGALNHIVQPAYRIAHAEGASLAWSILLDTVALICLLCARALRQPQSVALAPLPMRVTPISAPAPVVASAEYGLVWDGVRNGMLNASSQRALIRSIRASGNRVSQKTAALYHEQLQRDGTIRRSGKNFTLC